MTELVDTKMIAERLGVTVATVRKWRQRSIQFPEPTARFSGAPVWVWAEVERWARKREA